MATDLRAVPCERRAKPDRELPRAGQLALGGEETRARAPVLGKSVQAGAANLARVTSGARPAAAESAPEGVQDLRGVNLNHCTLDGAGPCRVGDGAANRTAARR